MEQEEQEEQETTNDLELREGNTRVNPGASLNFRAIFAPAASTELFIIFSSLFDCKVMFYRLNVFDLNIS